MASVELMKAVLALKSVGKNPLRREEGGDKNSVAGEETDSIVTQVQNSLLFSIAMATLISASELLIMMGS
jgi:hypothetical protein